jgi:hypothetical protein
LREGDRIVNFEKIYKTAEEAAPRIGHITAERLTELARSGYAPCYWIDDKGPLFRIAELREWITQNLIVATKGMPLPSRIELRVPAEARPVSDAPASIRAVEGLRHVELVREECPGVYFLCDEDGVVYAGQSKNVPARIRNHINDKHKSFDQTRVWFLPVPESELFKVETEFIRRLRPVLNSRDYPTSNGSKVDAERVRAINAEADALGL